MKAHTKKLLQYTSAVIALIALGLLSRRINGIPDACGDALWAMMVFCCWRIVLVLRFFLSNSQGQSINYF